MTPKLFTELGLTPEMLKAIARLGFEQASPVQAETIPLLMQGRDVVGQSQTGSGKTAAFGIPAIERIDPHKPGPQVLTICPTRELAVQVSEEIHKLAFFKRGIRALPIYGGQSYDRQYAGLRAGVQFVIGTPGRLMDHLERGTLNLAHVKTVILDEADEMLDMGFRDDIEFILQRVPSERQTVLFSATIPRPIEDLIKRYTRDAARVLIQAKALTVPTVEQVYYEVDRRWKFEALTRLIEVHDVKLAIIFCNTQRMVDDLTEHLNAAGYSADAIHGGMAQAGRDRVMNRFRKGSLEFLVATDVAARGIDVEGIEVVFNFDLPYDVEDYVHRIGRTGRAGRSGLAISFVSGREVFAIQQIERYTRQRLHRGRVPSHGEIEEAKINQLLKRVRHTLTAGNYRHYDHVIEALLEEGVDSLDLTNALLHRLAIGDPESTTSAPAKPKAAWGAEAPPTAPTAPAAAGARPPRAGAPARPATPRTPPSAPPTAVPSPAETAAETAPPPGTPAPVRPPARPPAAPRNAPAPTAPARENFPRPENRKPTRPAPGPTRDFASEPPFAAPHPPRQPRPPFVPPQKGPRDFSARRSEAKVSSAAEAAAVPPPPPEPMVRLNLSLGATHGIRPPHVVSCILGETGLPAATVGQVEVQPEMTTVEVASRHARAILARLNRTQIGGYRLKARLAN